MHTDLLLKEVSTNIVNLATTSQPLTHLEDIKDATEATSTNTSAISTTLTAINNKLATTDAGTLSMPTTGEDVLYVVPVLQGDGPGNPVGRIPTSTGAYDPWTPRVTIANDDPLTLQIKNNTAQIKNNTDSIITNTADISKMYTSQFDYRLLSPNKYRLVHATICTPYWPGNGNGGALLPITFGLGGTGNPPFFTVEQLIAINGAGSYLKVWGNTTSQINWSLPYDNQTITSSSSNDATAGTFARTLTITYYDNTNTLQTVTHSLSNTATTYNFREIVSMECNSWGTYKWNEGTISIIHASTNYAGRINPSSNKYLPQQIIIPHNGYVLLDKLHVYIDNAAVIKIFLVKQTSSTNQDNIFITLDQFYVGGLFHDIDLTHIPAVTGSNDLTQNWAIMALPMSGATTGRGVIKIIGKQYRP